MSSGLREAEREEETMRVGKAVQEFETFRLCVCAKQKRNNKSKAQKFKLQNATKQVEKGERERQRRRKPDKSNTQHDKVKRICNIKVKLVKKLEESK